MKREAIRIDGVEFPCIRTQAVVVGSGGAALNAAVQCRRRGVGDVAIVTERMGGGATANAGSDKQTYYRVDPSATGGDGVREMARELHGCGCMHGDVALVESALSLPSFHHLALLGVPFPHDRYGSYTGFKTDHDARSRGTSAGPRTSQFMYRSLRDEAERLGIPVFDGMKVIALITGTVRGETAATGCIAIERGAEDNPGLGLCAFIAPFVIYGTGGPAGLYRDSAYPDRQTGSLGPAILAGAVMQNLSESQFGIASVKVPWNLSGSYQQVLPRYYSCGKDGGEEREFLADFFPDAETMLRAQFLKGYQWPFDARRVRDNGSSLVDLLVYHETVLRGRKVYLDYRRNPSFQGYRFDAASLPEPARGYLENSGATAGTPVLRLKEMNRPAYELFLERGIDLDREPLEAAVCNQHLNGGLRGSLWWESNIRNFFPVGECCGTHGIYRPGGSALNSGQAAGIRCAQYIAHVIERGGADAGDDGSAVRQLGDAHRRLVSLLKRGGGTPPEEAVRAVRARMSENLGIIRSTARLAIALAENLGAREDFLRGGISGPGEIVRRLEAEDLLAAERAFLEHNLELMKRLKGGRGSFLAAGARDLFITDDKGRCRGIADPVTDDMLNREILETVLEESGNFTHRFVPVRPVPDAAEWFETMWRRFREEEIFNGSAT